MINQKPNETKIKELLCTSCNKKKQCEQNSNTCDIFYKFMEFAKWKDEVNPGHIRVIDVLHNYIKSLNDELDLVYDIKDNYRLDYAKFNRLVKDNKRLNDVIDHLLDNEKV